VGWLDISATTARKPKLDHRLHTNCATRSFSNQRDCFLSSFQYFSLKKATSTSTSLVLTSPSPTSFYSVQLFLSHISPRPVRPRSNCHFNSKNFRILNSTHFPPLLSFSLLCFVSVHISLFSLFLFSPSPFRPPHSLPPFFFSSTYIFKCLKNRLVVVFVVIKWTL
jgi:hypothetical protein